eukprot:Em0012g106a
MAPISPESTNQLWSHPQCSGTARDVGSLVGTGTHLPCGYIEQLRVCLKVLCNSQEWHPSPLVSLRWVPGWRRYTPTLWVHRTAQSLPQSALQLTRMAPISIGQLVHTYPVGTWNSSESAPKCFATHKNGTHLHCVLDPRVTLGPWLAQVHTYPVGTWNSSESAPKCFATHKNGTHLHCVLDPHVTLGPWLAQVHTYPVGTWNSSESAPKCFATHKNGTHLHWSACTHLPCRYMEQLRVCLKVLCNSQEWHPSPLVSLRWVLGRHRYTPTLWVHGTAQSLPQSALQLTRMAPISIGQLVHTYPVGTWNSSECASKCFATHKNGTHLDWSACTYLPCRYMEQLRVCLKVLCNSQEWHPSPLVSLYTPTLWVHGTAQSLPQSALQLTRMAPISIGQLVHTYPVGTWNSSESAPKCFATHKNGTHLHCVLDPRVTLGPWLAQEHTYPVGTWNSSESASKCFATHKNGTHLNWYTPTLWVHGTAQSLPQSALQLTRMAPISIGQLCSGSARDVGSLVGTGTHLPCGYMEQLRVCPKVLCNSQEWHPSPLVSLYTPTLSVHGTTQSLPQSALQLTRMAPISIGQLAQVHTYPVGTWNSSESAPKCFATHKNGTHLHCVLDPPVTLGPWLAQVHTYPVDTWNSSESAPKCFATHKNGTHLHCVPNPRVTLGPWLAQVHTYPVGTWHISESAPKCFATHKNGTHLHWSAYVGSLVGTGTHLPCGYMEQLRVCLKVLCNSQEWHPSRLVSLYTPTLWVHGTAQSLPQSALQLTRMAPISIGQLVHTYPVGTWNSSESAPKCFATHKNGTHLHWYTPTLWVHGTAQSLPQSALQLTRMAPIFTGQLVHTYPVGTWNSSESAPKCFATHKNGTHLHWSACTQLPCGYMEQLSVCLKVLCNSQEWHPSRLVSFVLDPRVTLGLRLAQVHTYPVGTWNSSESAPKCFATHKNGTHLHCVLDPRVTLGPWLAQVHTYPVGTWNSSEFAPKCFATHKNGTHLN